MDQIRREKFLVGESLGVLLDRQNNRYSLSSRMDEEKRNQFPFTFFYPSNSICQSKTVCPNGFKSVISLKELVKIKNYENHSFTSLN